MRSARAQRGGSFSSTSRRVFETTDRRTVGCARPGGGLPTGRDLHPGSARRRNRGGAARSARHGFRGAQLRRNLHKRHTCVDVASGSTVRTTSGARMPPALSAARMRRPQSADDGASLQPGAGTPAQPETKHGRYPVITHAGRIPAARFPGRQCVVRSVRTACECGTACSNKWC